ncbi:ORF6N domain-containing protein [Algoriphagus halophytocola]|uniref:ORF6N domain-containing protein n=1 Tax=Algoriphagus halophytocola TaxID=2991499 RepID=A0ABY6MBN0_9BACT|nr:MULTISPECIES: ORF6N domain-containing protein [unclassified Algoriphagus]UZD21020.1 ORF6N domain-containing protein [Algoriphagus sp. TR-M5]WBL42186.1 ORF6N domain-containing protein [Algoriphagus sp. TR-M9]
MKSHFATSRWGGRRTPPYVFTEQGVAMLSSVLNSPQAIQVNISIMRIFIKIREWAMSYSDLQDKIQDLQQSESDQNQHIAKIYQIIEELLKPTLSERKSIGFKK